MVKDDDGGLLLLPTALPQLLSVDDVAASLSVSSKTVRRMLERGTLSRCQVGRLVRIHRSDLERYIASSMGR